MFANMYLAFDLLSDGLKWMLEGQRAFHSLFGSRARVLNGRKPPTEEELARMGGAMHPVVITHPDTGRKCLFISDQVVDHFDGWTIEESKPLLDFIYAHASQPALRSEEHTSELQSLMRISYAVFCLKKKKTQKHNYISSQPHNTQ